MKPTKKPKKRREGVLFVQVGTETLDKLDVYAQALREANPWSKATRSDAVRELLGIALRHEAAAGRLRKK